MNLPESFGLIVSDFRREYHLSINELMALPAFEFYRLLWGLSFKSRWMSHIATSAEPDDVTESFSNTSTKGRLIVDRQEARKHLFGAFFDVTDTNAEDTGA